MMPTIDMRRFRRVLARIVENAVGQSVAVRWASQAYPRPDFPFIELRCLTGPSGTHVPRRVAARLPTGVRLTFAGAMPGSERRMAVNGMYYSTTADLDEAHRDALLTTLTLEENGLTATPVGAAGIELVPLEPGGLWGVYAVSQGITVEALGTADYLVTNTTCRLTVTIDAYGKAGRRPEPVELIERVMVALDDERVTLTQNRIGFSATASSDVRDLSGLWGADVELRAQRDLSFTIESRRAIELAPIETIVTARG